jgi:chaperonin cofactor prefoldin
VGKTIITAIAIDDVNIRFQNDPSIRITYLYYNFRQRDEQKIKDLFTSLLKQLSQEQPSLPNNVKALYDQHKDKRTRPLIDELSRALQSVSAMYSRVFIIVDALNECQTSDGCRSRLLSEIFNLQIRHGTNILATSRFIPDIVDRFKGNVTLEIRASSEYVEKYLEGYMKQLPSFVQRNQRLQEDIKTRISEAVDGMYVSS